MFIEPSARAYVGVTSGYRALVKRFFSDEAGGIEKIVAIVAVVLITLAALVIVKEAVEEHADAIPEPGSEGDGFGG